MTGRRRIARMSERDRRVLRSMARSYEQARLESQEYIDRASRSDRAEPLGRPHMRRVTKSADQGQPKLSHQ